MIEHFKRLFEYDYWANERGLAALEGTLSEEGLKKMGHILQAKAIWLSRLVPGTPVPAMDKVFSVVEGKELNKDLKARMDEYLSHLTPIQVEGKLSYKSMKGIPFENGLSDILSHMANHGTYHRGQIASLIKKAGGIPPETDFIVFAREEKA